MNWLWLVLVFAALTGCAENHPIHYVADGSMPFAQNPDKWDTRVNALTEAPTPGAPVAPEDHR